MPDLPHDPLGPMRLTAGPGDMTLGDRGGIVPASPPPALTWRYHRATADGPIRVVRAHGCDIDGGRVTWRDWHGAIVLSEPSDMVRRLTCEQADGTADDRPPYADESGPRGGLVCRGCAEAVLNGSDPGRDMRLDGHVLGCRHRQGG